jgi:signal transduction histidine kinase
LRQRADGARLVDLAILPAGGPVRWFAFVETVTAGRDGRAEVLRAGRDVTERVESARSLEEARSRAEAASVAKSRFLASVSHEFRTPLNAIDGLAGLLAAGTDGPLTAEQEKQVEMIRQSAASLTAMVNDMLDLSRVDAGKAPWRRGPVTVGTLFAAMRALYRAVHTDPAVELVFDAAHAAVALDTDEGKVAQILRNLVTNALKFTERGTVHVSATPLGQGCVSFVVQDTGPGIAAADQARVFEEFARVGGARAPGTGLGLPLSRGLATVLGGTLTLTSEPGRGSIFTLTIPAHLTSANLS